MQMYETSLKFQPQIKSSEFAIKSAEHNLAASRGRISPVLALQANIASGTSGLAQHQIGTDSTLVDFGPLETGQTIRYWQKYPSFEKTPIPQQIRTNFNQSIGLTLNIPIFNGLQTHTAIKNSKLAAWNAKLGLDLTKQNLYKSIAQAHANARAAMNKYNASKLSVEAAGESFKYAQQKFNAGAITAFEFNTAKNRLYSSESNQLQAKYDYIFKLKVLDFYRGMPLGF
jgi:outer membrane protein